MYQFNSDHNLECFKDYFESLLALLPGHVYWKGLDCRFLGCNDAQAELAGLKDRRAIVGLSAYDLVVMQAQGNSQAESGDTKKIEEGYKRQAEAIDRVDREVMHTGRSITLEESLILDDGTERIYLSKKVPLRDHDGHIVGLLGSSMDITEQKQAETEAKKLAKELEEMSQVKQMFLANMRHDIRTPFTGVLTSAMLLAEQEEDPEKKQLLQDMSESSQLLLNYLNEILEFTELDNGYVPYVCRAFDFDSLVTDCYKLFLPSATQKDLKLNKHYVEPLPKWIISDRFRLQRILINLISNAVKFTQEGQIDVAVELVEKQKDRKGLLKIMVKDTGQGIAQDKQNAIFEKFEMQTPAYKTTQLGVGLGLVAVKDLVESLGGHLYVNSKVGRGSEFVCVIPFEYMLVSDDYVSKLFKISEQPKVSESQVGSNVVSLHPQQNHIKHGDDIARILLVEDVNMAAKMAKHVLNKVGCIVDVAKSGEEAIDKATYGDYQLILMDIALPGKSGLETAKYIRNLPAHHKTPIVVLTSYNSEESLRACQRAGMHDVMAKPLSSHNALELVQKYQLKRNARGI